MIKVSNALLSYQTATGFLQVGKTVGLTLTKIRNPPTL
jgi:hypothetical protein